MSLARRSLAVVGLTIALGAWIPSQSRAEPVEAALNRVPDGTAICVVVRDLRTSLRTIADSPFVAWFRESTIGQRILDPKELQKLKDLHDFFAGQLGVTGEQLLDDVIGDAVVLAYKPGPPGKPDDETGVILIAPRKPEVLAQVVEKLNELQQKSGEIRAVRELKYKDRAFFEREKTAGGREYYQIYEGVFAFSGQLAGLHSAIDRQVAKTPGPSAASKGLKQLGLENRLAVCWFNPRSFDAELAAKEAATKDAGERAFLAQFRKVWAATESFALDLHATRGLELGVVAKFDLGKLPAELKDVLFPKPGKSALAAKIPPDALVAIVGRLDVPKIIAALETFLPAEGKAGLKAIVEQFIGPLIGKDKLPAVMAGIGPDWGFWMTAPPAGSKAWVPDWTVAAKLADTAARPVQQAIEFAAQTARIAYNRDHKDQIDFEEDSAGGTTVKFFVNEIAFPTGFRPAFAVTQGYLVVASSPEAVRRFVPATGVESVHVPLIRLSGTHLKAYLTTHGTAVAAFLGKTQGRAEAVVEKELKDLISVLEAIDRIDIRRVTTATTVRLIVQVQLTKSLGK